MHCLRLSSTVPDKVSSRARRLSVVALALLFPLLLQAQPGEGEPARMALVIGNADYSILPDLPACAASATELASTLQLAGFSVVAKQNASSGGMGAALAEYNRMLAGAPGATALIYFCGYALTADERPFILPASANIQRPSDVRTQGILTKVLTDLLSRGRVGAAVLALDLPRTPLHPPIQLDALRAVAAPDGLAVIAVSPDARSDQSTALSSILGGVLEQPDISNEDLFRQIQAALRAKGTALVFARKPVQSMPFYGAKATTGVEQPADPELASRPAPETESKPQAHDLEDESTPPAPVVAMPPEAEMSQVQRRQVQRALAALGYYAGAIDGLYGPETRAAIRRFQHELSDDMTGVISGAQATRLINGEPPTER